MEGIFLQEVNFSHNLKWCWLLRGMVKKKKSAFAHFGQNIVPILHPLIYPGLLGTVKRWPLEGTRNNLCSVNLTYSIKEIK